MRARYTSPDSTAFGRAPSRPGARQKTAKSAGASPVSEVEVERGHGAAEVDVLAGAEEGEGLVDAARADVDGLAGREEARHGAGEGGAGDALAAERGGGVGEDVEGVVGRALDAERVDLGRGRPGCCAARAWRPRGCSRRCRRRRSASSPPGARWTQLAERRRLQVRRQVAGPEARARGPGVLHRGDQRLLGGVDDHVGAEGDDLPRRARRAPAGSGPRPGRPCTRPGGSSGRSRRRSCR